MSRDANLAGRHDVALARSRIASIGREIEKRGDGKRSLHEVRMRHGERWAVDDHLFYPEHVQIDLPRPPAWATNSTEPTLDLEKQSHQLRRRTLVQEENRGVQERALRRPPNGHCFVDARSALDRNRSVELPTGPSQGFEAVADVTAQTDD
jgi:hypothetical protein